jgi:hypothetical protein
MIERCGMLLKSSMMIGHGWMTSIAGFGKKAEICQLESLCQSGVYGRSG